MSTTTNAVARRDSSAPAQQTAAALAIQSGQTSFDEYQNAALNQLGLREAGNGDRAVFLHVCQRTGLDPFARQIYMIGRNEEVDGKWGKKWTIQTGIEGWRVIRARAEAREKVRGILGRAVWYDADGNESKVWFRPEPPTACEITYTVRDASGTETPYTSVLMFREYVQTKKDGNPTQMWTVKGVHMLEKCVEADVYRKAFPTDFSGIQLDDAMPPADWDNMPDEELDQRARAVGYRPRVTAADARARNPQTATAVAEPAAEDGMRRYRPSEMDGTPEPSPAGTETTPGSVPSAPQSDVPAPAGEAPRKPQMAASGQVTMIEKRFAELYPGAESDADRWERLGQTAKLAGIDTDAQSIGDTKELTAEEAARVLDALKKVNSAKALEVLIGSGEVPRAE